MILLSIILIASIILNCFLVKAVSIASERLEKYEGWILNFRRDVEDTYAALKIVDDKQIFERDDEVGFVFSNIISIIDDLKEKTYVESQETEQEVKTDK